MAYAKSNDFGGYLEKLGRETEEVRAALESAADQMDQVFSAVRIEEVPIVPSNLVKPTAVVQATWDRAILQLTEWLRMLNLRLAGRLLSTGQSGTGSKLEKDAKWADGQLERIRLKRVHVNAVVYLQRQVRLRV